MKMIRYVKSCARDLRIRKSLKVLKISENHKFKSAVTVVCLIKDGEYYLKELLRMHRNLGVGHFVFVDNRSTDSTLEYLMNEEDVSVLSCDLPAKEFENDIRRIAALKFVKRNDWCLFIDSDEIFDFPGSDSITICELTKYLDEKGYTGMVAHMLEMFPNVPIEKTKNYNFYEVIKNFKFFDTCDIVEEEYFSRNNSVYSLLRENTANSENLNIKYGGIRKTIFGEYCMLTKHPLVKIRNGIIPGRHPHVSVGLDVSDTTGVIFHYKFSNDVISRDKISVLNKKWTHGEDKRRIHKFTNYPSLSLHTSTATKYQCIDQLLSCGFIAESDEFRQFKLSRLLKKS